MSNLSIFTENMWIFHFVLQSYTVLPYTFGFTYTKYKNSAVLFKNELGERSDLRCIATNLHLEYRKIKYNRTAGTFQPITLHFTDRDCVKMVAAINFGKGSINFQDYSQTFDVFHPNWQPFPTRLTKSAFFPRFLSRVATLVRISRLSPGFGSERR